MTALRQAFLAEIRRHRGTPYTWGGKGPTAFDCSGLLTWCARQVGLDLGNPGWTSADGLKGHCDPIGMDEVRPGDLYLFHSTYGSGGLHYATHCGVALGDGRFMLDTHADAGVGQTDITRAYWQQHLLGAYRPRGLEATEDDMAKVAELESLVGVLRQAGAAAVADIEKALAVEGLPDEAREPLEQGALPAAQTVARGGE